MDDTNVKTYAKGVTFVESDGEKYEIGLFENPDPFKGTSNLGFIRSVKKGDVTKKGRVRQYKTRFLSDDGTVMGEFLMISDEAAFNLYPLLTDFLLEKGFLKKRVANSALSKHTRGLCHISKTVDNITSCQCCETQMVNGKCAVCPSTKL